MTTYQLGERERPAHAGAGSAGTNAGGRASGLGPQRSTRPGAAVPIG